MTTLRQALGRLDIFIKVVDAITHALESDASRQEATGRDHSVPAWRSARLKLGKKQASCASLEHVYGCAGSSGLGRLRLTQRQGEQ